MTTPVAAPTVEYGLETPMPLRPAQNYFQLIGWAFLRGATRPCEVRVSVDGRCFAPVERSSRNDVATLFPDEPAALASGFKIIGYLPFGVYLGMLEISEDGKQWHRVRPLAIPVSSHPIRGSIDHPPPGETITKPVRLQGWCFHPEFEIREIVLQFGNVEVPCDIDIPRPDVATRFPGHPAAARSGFITSENLPRGSGPVKIRALTRCGRVYFVSSDHRVDIKEGWIPKPPPPSPLRDLSTIAIRRDPGRDTLAAATGQPTGGRNILFVLYGDFSANSALHVAGFAHELMKVGYDCVAAVPANKETVGALPRAGFATLNFDELPDLPTFFRDGKGPRVVHAWTSRENVRKFSTEVARRFGSDLFVHLEDNEHEILETRLKRPFAELAALPTAELDALVPDVLSHPHRAVDFMRAARGVTVIVDRLADHVPSTTPHRTIWPAANEEIFRPRPRDEEFRRRLGFRPGEVVLFYHGNTHTSNAAEVRSLYEAVALLNQRGVATQLIRTGRDFPEFLPDGDAWIRPYLVHVGHVGRAKRLPELMAVADYFVQPGAPGSFNDYRFPSKLPEFFRLGRPVILPRTNLGDVVRHLEDAWVVPTADAGAIADAVIALQGDAALRERLSAGAVRFAEEHFSWERSARRLLGFYQSLTTLGATSSS